MLADCCPYAEAAMLIPLPLILGRRPAPFDHLDWIYEIKHDGFRALVVIEKGSCRFLSRNFHPLGGFHELARAILSEIKADRAILDGELAVVDETGRSVFAPMMQGRRHEAKYCAFDVLSVNGTDLRGLALTERKARLRRMLP
jgi:bifunctional non-homologous end joining protein LigD